MKTRASAARLLVMALALSALVAPAAPVAAQESDAYWSLSSSTATVRRGGKAYQMTITAFEGFNTESVSVRLSQRRNPSGVTDVTQSHSFNFSTQDKFSHASTLATAKVATGQALGKYGALNISFAKNAPTTSSCNGHLKQRTGTLSGSVSIKTGTDLFGTITTRPGKATLTYHDGDCNFGGGSGGGGSQVCATAGRSGFAFRGDPSVSIYGSRPAGKTYGDLGVSWSETLDVAGGSLFHSILARLPAAKVSIADNLGSATFSGKSGTWLSGSATFTPSSPASTGSPIPCGSGKEYVNTSRSGAWSGNLKGDFWLGSDRGVAPGPTSGSLTKTVVRNR